MFNLMIKHSGISTLITTFQSDLLRLTSLIFLTTIVKNNIVQFPSVMQGIAKPVKF